MNKKHKLTQTVDIHN